MANNKFNYPIDNDRIYTLSYDGYEYKISGREIHQMFYREAYLEQVLTRKPERARLLEEIVPGMSDSNE